MNGNVIRAGVRLAICLAAIAALAGSVHAQSSLGIGAAEPWVAPTGPFAGFLQWVNERQQYFYHALTDAMRGMRGNPAAFWLLAGISFAYGIFHAAGPGHGKAVISSYMVANEVALRRGILLSFISAMLQAITAIVVMSAIFLFLRGTAITMTNATWTLELFSYGLVMLFGAWLFYSKVSRLWWMRRREPVAASLSAAHVHDTHHTGHGHGYGHSHSHDGAHAHHHHHGHSHAPGEMCEECGHSHAPDPTLIGGDQFDWRTAWSAIMAVGLRPCTGALIVLTFAFLNGMWVAGIASVLAMAVGTAITVSALATTAVLAKNVAVRLAGGGAVSGVIQSIFEIGGALLVFLLGLTLFAASLQGVSLSL